MCFYEREEMNKIQHATYRLAQACDGSPVSSTVVVMLFFVMFNFVEAGVEIALFGKRFEHALDQSARQTPSFRAGKDSAAGSAGQVAL